MKQVSNTALWIPLKGALQSHQQGVRSGKYPSRGKKSCVPTAACNELPVGAFEEFFGDGNEAS